MQKLDGDDDMVSSSPTSVSSGYCSQWMSPNTDGFSKQSSSEHTTCAESEFESDSGVNQKLLREFHCIQPKAHRGWSQLPSSDVQVTKKNLTCAQQCRKSVHHKSEALNCVLFRLDSASFPLKRNTVRSSSSDLLLGGLDETSSKSHSLNSGHVIDSNKVLAPAMPSLSKKHSKRPKKRLISQHASKVRYVRPVLNICRLPAGIISMNVKNIGNTLCWFQSATHMLNFNLRHKRTKKLHSNSEIIQPQSNSGCKQLQSRSYLKQCQSNGLKQYTGKSKSDVKNTKLNHDKKQLTSPGVKRHRQSKREVKHSKSNKCKEGSYEADIEEEHHKVTDEKHSCSGGVIHNSTNGSGNSKDVQSYKCNAEQIQHASPPTMTNTQNPVSFCSISDLNRLFKKRLNHEQCSVRVTDATHGGNGSTVRESLLGHRVSTSNFRRMKGELDSHVSALCCHSVLCPVKLDEKPRDTLENLTPKNPGRRVRVKCIITGKSECSCQQCQWRPCDSAVDQVHRPTLVLSKCVIPENYHKQSSSICHRKYQRSPTNTETHANGAFTNETDRILSSEKFPHLTDIQTKVLQHYSEGGIKPNCRNLFETFLNEIPSTCHKQNLTEEIMTKPEKCATKPEKCATKPEKCAIQNSDKHHNNSLVIKSDYSVKDLGLIEPSHHSVQLTTENSRNEQIEPNAALLETNDDMYSDISDDISPDAVSAAYDMFSDISDCIPDDLPINANTNGNKLPGTGRNILPDSGVRWANDLHSVWLQSQFVSLPTSSNMSLGLINTNAIESHNEKKKEALLDQVYSPCSCNRDDILNCQEHCSTVIQNNLSVGEDTYHTEIQTSSTRPCSVMVRTISKGHRCAAIGENDSLCRRRSCGEFQTSEAHSPSDRRCCFLVNQTSGKTLNCEQCCRLLEAQKGLSIVKKIAYVQNESPVCEHSSSQIPGKVLTCKIPCSVETQKGVSIYEETASIQVQKELLGFDFRNTLETIYNSEEFLSHNISKENLTYEGPHEFAVKEVSEIPCSGKSLVVETPYSEEGPLVSEICDTTQGHLVLGATCCKEDLMVSDITCFKKEHLTSEGPYCKVGPLVSEVVLQDSCSKEELLLSEGQSCKKKHLVSKESLSNTGLSDGSYTNEGTAVSELSCFKEVCLTSEAHSSNGTLDSEALCVDVTQKEILTPDTEFSGVPLNVAGSEMLQTGSTGSQEGFDDLLTAGASSYSDTNDVSLNLEDLFPFVLQEPPEGIADSLNYKDLVSCEMQQGSPAVSQSDNIQENSLITQTSCITTFQDDDIDSLDEDHNECISDSIGTCCKTLPFISGATMPRHLARAKTKSWLQEYQSQMLENQQRTHKNWKLLVSVIDDRRPGRKCAQRKTTSGNRSRKQKSSRETNKTGHQPKTKTSCSMICNSEPMEPEPNENFEGLQQDFCGVDLPSQSNFSIDGALAAFQNMVLNGDPSMLSLLLDQGNTWLSIENIESTIDQADLGHNIHNELQFETVPASDSLTSDNTTFSIAPLQSDLLDPASALPIQQPESIMPRELPELALNSATSIDSETFAMLSENCGNVESLNVLSLDAVSDLNTVAPRLTEVPDLDPEMLQYLLSAFIQSRSAGVLPGISYNQGSEIVTSVDVNRGIIYVLNNSNSVTQPVDCSQTLDCDTVQECNKHKIGSQCQVEGQTFTPGLILSDGNNIFAKVNNPKSTEHSDSSVYIAQNSTLVTEEVLSEGDSQRAQNNSQVMDIGEFRTSNTTSASNLEQLNMNDVVEIDVALLSEKCNVLENQQHSSNTLSFKRNYEISDTMTGNYSDDRTHQKSVAVLLEKGGGGGAVMAENGSKLSMNECSDTGLAKRLFIQDCSDVVLSPQNYHPNENNQSQSVLPTGNKQNPGMELLADNYRMCGHASGNCAVFVDRQRSSESKCISDAHLHQRSIAESSSELNGLSVGEDSLSDKSDMLLLTCEDAGDNAAIFLEGEEEEEHFYETSDVIMLCCNDSQEKDTETAHFNAATSSPQEQCTFQGNNSASRDHVVSAAILLEGNQSSFENGNQKTKHFDQGFQKNPNEEGNQKSSEEIIIEKFNRNCYKDIQNCLEDDNNKSSKEVCQALRSGSCEDAVVTKVVCTNLANFHEENEPDLLPNWKHMVLHPKKKTSGRKRRRLHSQGNVLLLADKQTSEENSKVKTKPKKSKAIRETKTSSYVVESHVTSPDSITQNTNVHDIKRTNFSGGITTELSFDRANEQTEGNLNESRVNETSYSRMQTEETGEANSCTEPTQTLNHHQNGIKLRIVKVRSGVWQAHVSCTDPTTQQQQCSHNDDCTVSSGDLRSQEDLIYISEDDSNTDSQNCLCIDDEICQPNNRLMTTLLPTSALLHRFGCKCVSCAEQQFLYGGDNSMSLFTAESLTRDLMRYKRFMSENRSPSQVHGVASIRQSSPVLIDDGSNSNKPIYIL